MYKGSFDCLVKLFVDRAKFIMCLLQKHNPLGINQKYTCCSSIKLLLSADGSYLAVCSDINGA